MTEEVCARPGCGHEPKDHDVDGCLDCTDIALLDFEYGRCPSYRTEAQQEAWESAARSSALTGAGGNVPVGVLRRLLELYP
jgi:hypothetical protein